MAKTAFIPPSNETTATIFVLFLTALIILHIFILLFGIKKITSSATIGPAPNLPRPHQPAPLPLRSTISPTPVVATEKQATTPNLEEKLEKLDQTLKLLEEKLKKPREPQVEAAAKHEQNLEAVVGESYNLSEILQLAKQLKEEINTAMTRGKRQTNGLMH